MAIRNIVKKGDELLTKKSRIIEKIDNRILELMDDMAETMYANDGVGIAAPQVGVLKRVVLVDIGGGLIELINPTITKAIGECIDSEGCLSVPDIYGTVKRPQEIFVTAYNRDFEEFSFQAEGFFARAICHELDHLDGILFTDKVISYDEED